MHTPIDDGEHDERANLVDIVHEPRAVAGRRCAALLLRGGAVGAADRVHGVAGEGEEQIVGAAVGDGAERAQGHEQHVQPVRERQHAAGWDAARRRHRLRLSVRSQAEVISELPGSMVSFQHYEFIILDN